MRHVLQHLARQVRRASSCCWPVCQEISQPLWPHGQPLVSVIIPCFNYGQFVVGAVKSVLAQTCQRYEVLVVDDGSTDAYTQAVLADLEEMSLQGRIRVVHQNNQGLAATRNNGAAQAAGKYVCYLDADDLFEPTYLEKTLTVLERDASLGSCYSWVWCFGDSSGVWRTKDLEPYRLREGNTAPSHSVIRKEAWQDVRTLNGSGFVSKYDGYFEDWVFWIDMIQCGYRGRVIKEPLIRYRIHQQSLGARHRSGYADMLRTLHKERAAFFGDSTYVRRLERSLNRRIYVRNSGVNLGRL